MNSRSLGALLRCSQCAARTSTRASAQQRLFTSSAVLLKHGAVPSFTEVSSPELQELLNNIRLKVFLPVHLSDSQALLTKREKYHKQLQNERTVATIAGEEFVLEPRTRHLKVGKYGGLYKAMGLMKEKKDWDNLPNLLRGLKIVQKSMGRSEHTWNNLTRLIVSRLGAVGRQDVLLECLRRGSETGIVMSSREFSNSVFACFGRKAFDSDFDITETKKALSWAEQAVVLMEKPEHAGNTSLAGEDDPRTSPEVIGAILQLAAVRVAKHLNGKDSEMKVATYTEKFLNTPVALNPMPDSENGYILHPWLFRIVPILHGMNLAQSLQPGTKSAEELRSRAYVLSEQVSECKSRLEEWDAYEKSKPPPELNYPHRKKTGGRLQGLQLYDRLIGAGSL